MRLRWVGILAKVTLIFVLGLLLVERSAQGQDNQDREARIHQKMERLRALVEQRQQEGINIQPVGELMLLLFVKPYAISRVRTPGA